MKGKTILCSPLSLFAILSVIRQSIDNFSLERKSREMLSLLGTFRQQWEKFKDQMETVKERFDQVHRGYEELVGVRERQLDRPLQRLDEARLEQGIGITPIEQALESATKKNVAHRRNLHVSP